MTGEIVHVGVSVTDIERSVKFYRDVLGLKLTGRMEMKGEATDKLFNMENILVKLAYLNGSDNLVLPPVELIEIVGNNVEREKAKLNRTSISEICFKVKDMDKFYDMLLKNNVKCLSEPQYFDFTEYGFSKSKAIYFYDPDGIILEAMEYID